MILLGKKFKFGNFFGKIIETQKKLNKVDLFTFIRIENKSDLIVNFQDLEIIKKNKEGIDIISLYDNKTYKFLKENLSCLLYYNRNIEIPFPLRQIVSININKLDNIFKEKEEKVNIIPKIFKEKNANIIPEKEIKGYKIVAVIYSYETKKDYFVSFTSLSEISELTSTKECLCLEIL